MVTVTAGGNLVVNVDRLVGTKEAQRSFELAREIVRAHRAEPTPASPRSSRATSSRKAPAK